MPPPVPLSSGLQPKISKDKPHEGKEASIRNQFQALHTEEGEIRSLETILANIEEEEIHASISIPPPYPRNERIEQALEGSTTPGVSWAEMVKHNKLTQQGFSPEQLPSQSSQELHDVALQPNTRGRKLQRYHREREAEREIEFGRQRSLEETKLLQSPKNLGGTKMDGRS